VEDITLKKTVANGVQKKGFFQTHLYTDSNFKPGRYQQVSWTPVFEKETFLIGGGSHTKSSTSKNSSTIVKPGTFEGTAGFNLKYKIYAACSMPDPETDTVIITGGNDYSPRNKITSLYNEDGWVEDFGNLNYERVFHGCTSYVADKKREDPIQ